MSKNAKLNAREQRRRQKAKAKAQKASEYAARAATGDNSKSRGARRASKRPPVLARHAVLNCGNVGCRRCFPEYGGRRARGRRYLEVSVRFGPSWYLYSDNRNSNASQKVSAPRE